jgi:hypothetical protein
MEVKRRWGRRRKKLLDDLKDRRGYSHLKEEALDRIMLGNRFGGGIGLIVRQNTEWMVYSAFFKMKFRCETNKYKTATISTTYRFSPYKFKPQFVQTQFRNLQILRAIVWQFRPPSPTKFFFWRPSLLLPVYLLISLPKSRLQSCFPTKIFHKLFISYVFVPLIQAILHFSVLTRLAKQ